MQRHAATWCTCGFWAGWVPFLPSLFVEERHWGMNAHCWAWKMLESRFTGGSNRGPEDGPNTAAGRNTCRKRVDNKETRRRRNTGRKRSPRLPCTSRQRFRNENGSGKVPKRNGSGTALEPFWHRFRTLSGPFLGHVSFGGTLFGTLPEPFLCHVSFGGLCLEPSLGPVPEIADSHVNVGAATFRLMLLREPLWPGQPPRWWSVLGTLSGHLKTLGGYWLSGWKWPWWECIGWDCYEGVLSEVKCVFRAKRSAANGEKGSPKILVLRSCTKGLGLLKPLFCSKILSSILFDPICFDLRLLYLIVVIWLLWYDCFDMIVLIWLFWHDCFDLFLSDCFDPVFSMWFC